MAVQISPENVLLKQHVSGAGVSVIAKGDRMQQICAISCMIGKSIKLFLYDNNALMTYLMPAWYSCYENQSLCFHFFHAQIFMPSSFFCYTYSSAGSVTSIILLKQVLFCREYYSKHHVYLYCLLTLCSQYHKLRRIIGTIVQNDLCNLH